MKTLISGLLITLGLLLILIGSLFFISALKGPREISSDYRIILIDRCEYVEMVSVTEPYAVLCRDLRAAVRYVIKRNRSQQIRP